MKVWMRIALAAALFSGLSIKPASAASKGPDEQPAAIRHVLAGIGASLMAIDGGGNQIYLPASVTVNPLSVNSGTSDRVYVTVKIEEPATTPGQPVYLSYSNPRALVNPPGVMWVYPGDLTVSFYVTPQFLTFNTQVTVTATCYKPEPGSSTSQPFTIFAAVGGLYD